MRETFPSCGTLVSQTLLNIVRLALLGRSSSPVPISSTPAPRSSRLQLRAPPPCWSWSSSPRLDASQRNGRSRGSVQSLHRALLQVRAGLAVFATSLWHRRKPLRSSALAIQLAACWALLAALGLNDHAGIRRRRGGAVRVNVTAVVLATRPTSVSSSSPDQCAAYRIRISTADALAYGVISAGGRDRHGRGPRAPRSRPRRASPGAICASRRSPRSGPPRAAPVQSYRLTLISKNHLSI